jgi:UDP-2,4-diacetamido-2,4,6-trideoxy-beta-L-altropyranose hydrolase
LPSDCKITVIMGKTSPWLDEVNRQAATMRWPTTVRVGVSNMAQIMAESDLAIGAAGSTSWERCCLGLPTILMVLAENQKKSAISTEQMGAAILIDADAPLERQLENAFQALVSDPAAYSRLVSNSAAVADGLGATRVAEYLVSNNGKPSGGNGDANSAQTSRNW